MSLWLDTRGKWSVAIAICDRCKMKRSITHLVSDPNAPGLRVCMDTCVDVLDPYRLPARQPENITLNYPRPDVPLVPAASVQIQDELVVNDGGEGLAVDGDGNTLEVN